MLGNTLPQTGSPEQPSTSRPAADAAIALAQVGLVDRMAEYGGCVIALSGGVDSAVVAAAGFRALGTRAIAVTAVSPSLPSRMLDLAKEVASSIGIVHQTVSTHEHLDPRYTKNDSRRCYFCKQTLYQSLELIRQSLGLTFIVSGTNADDLGDYRPGIEAGREANVRTPLADLGIGKSMVRELARDFGLSVAELPAAPCLSSRIAYGESVSPERLQQIESAENYFRELGVADVRVRFHPGDLARIEVSPENFEQLTAGKSYQEIAAKLHGLGFRYVTLDLDGLSSGSMNRVFQIDPLP